MNTHIKSKNELLVIKKSKIPKAGLGAFAKSYIAKGARIGEYRGAVLDAKGYERVQNKLYMFEVSKKTETGRYKIFYIDGVKQKPGHELRFVNGSFGKKQRKSINVESYQYAEKIFYRATKNIKSGEEIIIDYGDSYWS